MDFQVVEIFFFPAYGSSMISLAKLGSIWTLKIRPNGSGQKVLSAESVAGGHTP